jgi:DnaJ-class molecular chaperone
MAGTEEPEGREPPERPPGGAKEVPCPRCRGKGSIQTRDGWDTQRETCPRCRGSGRVRTA